MTSVTKTVCILLVFFWLVSLSQAIDEQPNILLIVSEDNGPELGCYGEPSVKTPHLDRLARQGVRFQNAYVTYSVCSPSRAGFLTGLYPTQNGQIGLATHKYAMYQAWPNMASLLKEAGYRTGLIGKLHVNPESAFPFDFRWNDSKYIGFAQRHVKMIAEKAGSFMTQSDDPFFLSVNYPDAHFNLIAQQYGLPPTPLTAQDVKTLKWVGADSERLREYTANYYNCLMRLDAGVGLLLEKLNASGKANNTLIIYLGDHGAQFSRGKTSVYEAATRIPLIVSWPDHDCDEQVVKALVSTIDILPTVLTAAGVEAPEGLPGRSLLPLMQGKRVPWRRYIFTETYGSAPVLYYPQFAIRDARFKLIVNPLRDRPNTCAVAYLKHHNSFFDAGTTQQEIANSNDQIRGAYERYMHPPLYELYDLKNDPHEFQDLSALKQYTEIQERLVEALRNWQDQIRHPLRDVETLSKLTREHDHLLKVDYRKDKNFQWQYPRYFFEKDKK